MPTPTRKSQGKQKKIDTVTKLTEKLEKAKSVVFADYRGLTHKQLEAIKKKVKKAQGEFVVTKNTLLTKAFATKEKTPPELREPTATLFAYGDEVAPLRELVKFFKDANFGRIKSGLLGTQVLNEATALKLSQLPTRQTLRTQLLRNLQAPLYGLHNALSWNMKKLVWTLEAVKTKKA